MDPSAPGLQVHRIDGSRDARFWSVRASRDIRVIALHRAARLAREETDGRVLLTTFSHPLANAPARKLAALTGAESGGLRRVTLLSEWRLVVDAWQIADAAAYARGRGPRQPRRLSV